MRGRTALSGGRTATYLATRRYEFGVRTVKQNRKVAALRTANAMRLDSWAVGLESARMPSPPYPIDSATVIVLRDAGPVCEVLLVQRHADSRAFGGAHVFPGGVVDAADSERGPQRASRLSPTAAAARLGEPGSTEAALAFWIAAIRELYEETGLLLAAIDGTPVRLDDA